MNRMKKFMALLLAVVLIAQSGFTSSATEASNVPAGAQTEAAGTDTETIDTADTEQPESVPDETADEQTPSQPEEAASGETAAVTTPKDTPQDTTAVGNPAEGAEEAAVPGTTEETGTTNEAEDGVTADKKDEEPEIKPETTEAILENAVMPMAAEPEKTAKDGTDRTYHVGPEAEYKTIQDAITAVCEAQKNNTDAEAVYTIEIAEGEYGRFLVPHGADNIVIKGQGDNTIIKTLDASELSVDIKEKHDSDGQGIIIWGGNVTLKDMKIISGTENGSKWYASAVGTNDIMWGPAAEQDMAVTLDNCTFEGAGKGFAFMPQRSKYTVNNCRISGYEQAIYFAADGFETQDCQITGNTISDCVYAIHGYYGGNEYDKVQPLKITGNTISGTSDRFAVIAVLDQSNAGSLKLDIADNTFSYTIVGGINQRKDGDVVQGSMQAVKDANTMKDYSFVADAYWYSGTDYGTSFYVSSPEGKIAVWYADPTSEAGNNLDAIKGALDDYGTAGQVIEINAPAQEVFTVAKNAIVVQEFVDAGDLKIEKKVEGNDLDTAEFTFTVKLSREDGRQLNGSYNYIDKNGETKTAVLEDGKFEISLGAGESITVKDLLPGTRYEVTEAENTSYVSESTGASGVIQANETQNAVFTNTHKPTEIPDYPATEWETSKSKTATNLDENYESKVTLSLPAADYKPTVDVVFAIDATSLWREHSSDIQNALTTIANELLAKENLQLNVGVIAFGNGYKTLWELQEVNENTLADLKKQITGNIVTYLVNKEWISGTNVQLGVREGKKMLDMGNALPQDKYLFLITDGGSFWYCNDEDVSVNPAWNYGSSVGAVGNMDGNGDLGRRSDTPTHLTKSKDFADFMATYGADLESSVPASYSKAQFTESKNNGELLKEIQAAAVTGAQVKSDDYFLNMERGTYFAARELQKVRQAGYQVMTVGYIGYYPEYKCLNELAEGFLDWTAEIGNYYDGTQLKSLGETIANDLIRLVDAGSVVVDEIGKTQDYDFTFVNKIDAMSLSVAGKDLDVTAINDTTYGFGKDDTLSSGYQFILKYYENGLSYKGNRYGECFVWNIYVPITVNETVQLHYTVKLTNPKKDAGSYGQYDEDGSKGYEGLYTNNQAVLYPVDTNGNSGTPEKFQKPTVSYTVEKTDPVTPATAQLNITKKVVNDKGAAVKTDKTFYAAVFTDSAYKNRYGSVAELKLSGTSEVTKAVTVEVPKDGTAVTYYVAETDKDGNVILGGKDFGYQITIDGKEVTVSSSKASADVTITNHVVKKSSGGKKHHSSNNSSDTVTSVSTQSAVNTAKTGDTANILLPLLTLMLAAVMLGAYGVMVYKKRKRS